jgi:DNA-directed RNA polymerases I, II, and III subunit RPABC3
MVEQGMLMIGCRRVFISFGGLLLYIDGAYKKLTSLRVDRVYLCLRK